MSSRRRIIQVQEKVPLKIGIPLSLQHMFAMFSASVLVPVLFGINPAIVLLMNGVGTLIFIAITGGKSPAYLGSSFAFLAPTFLILANPRMGYEYALGGFVVSGAVFCLCAIAVKFFGTEWINVLLPPAAMGPVVALIGLELAGVAASNGLLTSTTYQAVEGTDYFAKVYQGLDYKIVAVFVFTLAVAVFGSILFKKFLSCIPILIAIIAGYIVSIPLGIVDFTAISEASVFAIPNFSFPKFDITAITIILPATLVVISEHIGHQIVTSTIVGKDLLKDPGLHRTLLSDGVSTMLSGFCGSVPTTTYGENIGVMAITKVYSVWVIGGAAVCSILVSFIGKVSGAIQTIPGPVMGGVSFLLYGMIAASGIRLMVDDKVDYSKSRNLALTAVTFVTGLSGAAIRLGEVQLKGMALATVVAMLLSLCFYIIDKLGLANDMEGDDAEIAE